MHRQFREAGLQPVPSWSPTEPRKSPERLRFFVGRIAQGLPADEAQEFRAAVHHAIVNRTMLRAEPYFYTTAIRP